MATILKDLRDKNETFVVDAGGVTARSATTMERETSGILVRLMDSMGYALINLTPGDIALMRNNTLQQTALLSSNYQDKDSNLLVHKNFDYTDAKGRQVRFFGVYDGSDSRFSSAPEWLDAIVCPSDRINVLLYYADRKPDATTQALLQKFDAVIANLKLPDPDVRSFVPLAQGKQMIALTLNGKDDVIGRNILVGDHVPDDAEVLSAFHRDKKVLVQNREVLERTQYLHMTPEEFMKSYQGELQ